MENSRSGTRGAIHSRRQALILALGVCRWLPQALTAAEVGAPVRLAISESLVADVNLNDARAAMTIWLRRLMVDLNFAIEFNPRVFDATEEILRRARSGQLDAVALNVVEYRQIAETLDSSQIMGEVGAAGMERYLLLVKRSSGIQRLGDLRGRRLLQWKVPKMCVADAWLSTILDEGRFGPSEQFFASVTPETKASRVVLPVFFGLTEACLTTQRSFDMMGELNPQVGRELNAIDSSPAMALCFYAFRKNYHGVSRDSFARVCSNLRTNAAGRQLETLFQFDDLTVRDGSCLASALGVLDAAERVRGRQGAGGRKG